ncbi:MAG: hypothetical protein ACTSYZ_03415 [Candidatus Helarchaeota archaeon]
MNPITNLNWLKNLNPFLKQKKVPIIQKIETKSVKPQKRSIFKRNNRNFGSQHNLDGINYITLKVIPKSKRTKNNCNSCGIKLDN